MRAELFLALVFCVAPSNASDARSPKHTHVSRLETVQHEGDPNPKHVEAGERLGVSGIGNGVPHLHVGLPLDDEVEQGSWDTLLVEGEIRKVFGGYKNGEKT
jgi:hypothetical protein